MVRLPRSPSESFIHHPVRLDFRIVTIQCKICVTLHAKQPNITCKQNPIRCATCYNKKETCVLIDEHNKVRLAQVQALGKQFRHWQAQEENQGVFSPKQAFAGGWRLKLNADGLIELPESAPQIYVDLCYAQRYLLSEMKGSSRGKRRQEPSEVCKITRRLRRLKL